jgi:hypothetical protein
VYPDYYERPPPKAKASTKAKGSGRLRPRKKMGKVDEEVDEYYDYRDDNQLDHRIRNVRRNEAIFR